MKSYFKLLTAVALAALIALPAVAVASGSYSTVNKSIRIGDNATAGDIDSVNGSIRIGANSFVDSVEAVNGSIKLGNDVCVTATMTGRNRLAILHGADIRVRLERIEIINAILAAIA